MLWTGAFNDLPITFGESVLSLYSVGGLMVFKKLVDTIKKARIKAQEKTLGRISVDDEPIGHSPKYKIRKCELFSCIIIIMLFGGFNIMIFFVDPIEQLLASYSQTTQQGIVAAVIVVLYYIFEFLAKRVRYIPKEDPIDDLEMGTLDITNPDTYEDATVEELYHRLYLNLQKNPKSRQKVKMYTDQYKTLSDKLFEKQFNQLMRQKYD